MAITWVAKGASGAQPMKPSPQNQSTQAGPQTVPGTQAQPAGSSAQRP